MWGGGGSFFSGIICTNTIKTISDEYNISCVAGIHSQFPDELIRKLQIIPLAPVAPDQTVVIVAVNGAEYQHHNPKPQSTDSNNYCTAF